MLKKGTIFMKMTHFRDVQLLVACCVADILRIFAPEAPYKSEDQVYLFTSKTFDKIYGSIYFILQIKTIFNFLITQLGGLKDPKDPAFKRFVSFLKIFLPDYLTFIHL